MNRKRIFLVAVFAVIIGLGTGTYLYLHTKKQVENTVRGYNNALIQAMRRPEPELMNRWSTVKERERVTMYILFLYGKEQKLDAKLAAFKIMDVKFNRQNATVITDEVWEDKYLNVKTGQEVGNPEHMHYQGTYKLAKDQYGNWVVEELAVDEL